MRNAAKSSKGTTSTKKQPLQWGFRLIYLLSQASLLPLAAFAIGRAGIADRWSGVVVIGFYVFGLVWTMIYVLLFTISFPARLKEALIATAIPLVTFSLATWSSNLDVFEAAYGVFFSSFVALAFVIVGIFWFVFTKPTLFGLKRVVPGLWIGAGITALTCIAFIYSISGPMVRQITSEGNILTTIGWMSQIFFQTRSLWLVLRGKTGMNTEMLEMRDGMQLTGILVTICSVLIAFFALSIH